MYLDSVGRRQVLQAKLDGHDTLASRTSATTHVVNELHDRPIAGLGLIIRIKDALDLS